MDFYKVPPGKQDEWLALYKKYHYPIMQYQKAHGQVISETVYTRADPPGKPRPGILPSSSWRLRRRSGRRRNTTGAS